jgi:hypothetical protein
MEVDPAIALKIAHLGGYVKNETLSERGSRMGSIVPLHLSSISTAMKTDKIEMQRKEDAAVPWVWRLIV